MIRNGTRWHLEAAQEMGVRDLYVEILRRIARVKVCRDERGVDLDVGMWVSKVIANYCAVEQ